MGEVTAPGRWLQPWRQLDTSARASPAAATAGCTRILPKGKGWGVPGDPDTSHCNLLCWSHTEVQDCREARLNTIVLGDLTRKRVFVTLEHSCIYHESPFRL